MLGFYVTITGILFCIAGFGGIFLVILALNLTRVRMNNPKELLRGGNTGEKEPRAKWLMALLGMISLGVGYYLAVTTESPIQACRILFHTIDHAGDTDKVAGFIVELFVLSQKFQDYNASCGKKKIRSCHNQNHCQKKNAAGLASICILSTGVLRLFRMFCTASFQNIPLRIGLTACRRIVRVSAIIWYISCLVFVPR